jgi:hypothetical protein
VHSDDKVREAFRLRREAVIQREIAERTGVSLGQIRKWLHAGEAAVLMTPMRATQHAHDSEGCSLTREVPTRQYSYLLGQYLGDGCITRMKRDVYKLSITTCDDYPAIRVECRGAIEAVMPGRSVCFVQHQGCGDLYGYSKHWPCVFPQHGPGRKHTRKIELEPWQFQIVMRDAPDDFVRGLIHSDGCRAINRVGPRDRRYQYVRYFFSNRSRDIRFLFMDACGALGVDARHNNDHSVSVAKRYSVALLDEIVGPKS